MIPLLTLFALPALATAPNEAELYQRLLGGDPPPGASASAPSAPSRDWTGLWPLGVAAAGAAFVVVGRRVLPGAQASPAALRVAGKVAIGGSSSLLLIDADDGAGGVRRLLISGGSGPAALLADLGEPPQLVEQAAERLAAVPAVPPLRDRRKAAGLALIDEVLGARRIGETT